MVKQQSTEARIATLEAQLRGNSHPESGDVVVKVGVTSREAMWGRNRGHHVLICQAFAGKHLDPG